jgi:chloramphenicol-sensitive protein RarD
MAPGPLRLFRNVLPRKPLSSYTMNHGILYAAGAYAAWGLFPLYFKALQSIPPDQILLHRMVWSLLFLVIVLAARRQWAWLGDVMRKPKVLAGFAASAILLSTNWFIYIWAVNNGRVVDSSLGYFINPLVNVLLGFLLLRERLRPVQWFAVSLAAAGVAWLTWQTGQLPWVALSLAGSFGLYGLLRKTAALGALEGLALETLLLFPVALVYLGMLTMEGRNAFLSAGTLQQWLLAAAGPITAIPLLMFATGARRIPLSLLGMLQYIGPTLQLLLGVWLYHEPFGGARLVGFMLIWSALAVYSLESVWQAWSSKRRAA